MLKLLASSDQDRKAGIVHVPINRRDFAAYLATTEESVSRSIQALVRRGTIAVINSANFRVLKRADLIAISRQDEEHLIEMVRRRNTKKVTGPLVSADPYVARRAASARGSVFGEIMAAE